MLRAISRIYTVSQIVSGLSGLAGYLRHLLTWRGKACVAEQLSSLIKLAVSTSGLLLGLENITAPLS
jgi:hypothetical protein